MTPQPKIDARDWQGLWDGRRFGAFAIKVVAIRGYFEPAGGVNKFSTYDDLIVCMIGAGKAPALSAWYASTDPTWLLTIDPINPKGAAQLCPGEHLFAPGLHRGTWPAFVQSEKFHIRRLDRQGKPTGLIECGDYGIHLHSGGESNQTRSYSAGCQIIRCDEGYFGGTWQRFYGALLQAMHASEQRHLPYLLIERKDIAA